MRRSVYAQSKRKELTMNLKEQFIQAWEREFPTTLKVLKAFPNDQGEFKPHERSPSAKELAWHFVQGQVAVG